MIFNIFVDVYVRYGKMVIVCRIFKEMLMKGYEFIVCIYNRLLDGCGRVGDFCLVVSVLEIMNREGIKLDRVMFIVFIDGFGKVRWVEVVLKLL